MTHTITRKELFYFFFFFFFYHTALFFTSIVLLLLGLVSKEQTTLLLGGSLVPAYHLSVGDHVQGDRELLEHTDHVPVELGRALDVRGPPVLPDQVDDLLPVLLGGVVHPVGRDGVLLVRVAAAVGPQVQELGPDQVHLVGRYDHWHVRHVAAVKHLVTESYEC